MTDSSKYPGNELELFQHARHWKKYFSKQIRPYIKGDVLEVGAGIGATTPLINDGSASSWILLEPDPAMSQTIQEKIQHAQLPANCICKTGTLENVAGKKFDTIIYIDVLEHIDKDADEIKKAALLLKPGGLIIILCPAFQFLYNPFDKAIGHYRRYNKKMFRELTTDDLKLTTSRYYDTVGYFAALFNKLVLKQDYPGIKQVLFWDRWLIPISTVLDKVFFHRFGKSIIAVWEKSDPA